MLFRWGNSSRSDDAILSVLQGIERSGYHLTLSYFWVQMVTYHIAVEAKERRSVAVRAGGAPVTVFGAFELTSTQTHTPAAMAAAEFSLQEIRDSLAEQAAQSDTTEAATGPGTVAPGTVLSFTEFLLRPHCQPLRNALLYNK